MFDNLMLKGKETAENGDPKTEHRHVATTSTRLRQAKMSFMTYETTHHKSVLKYAFMV